MAASPVRVAVTGAAGQIGYSLLFRIASGGLLGPDQPVILQLLEITPALGALAGRRHGARRLRLSAPRRGDDQRRRPMWRSATPTSPCWSGPGRGRKGMERKDLLEANGAIFTVQGKALSDNAGARHQGARRRQPGQHQRPHRHAQRARTSRAERFTAMTRLDQNRAMAQLAAKSGRPVDGRHQHDDLGQPLGHPVPRRVPGPDRRAAGPRGHRGRRPGSRRSSSRPSSSGARPSSRPAGASSAASAASAAIDHVHDWVLGTRDGRLGVDGHTLRRLLRGARGAHLVVPGHHVAAATTRSCQGLDLDEFSPGPHRRLGRPSWARSGTPSASSACIG